MIRESGAVFGLRLVWGYVTQSQSETKFEWECDWERSSPKHVVWHISWQWVTCKLTQGQARSGQTATVAQWHWHCVTTGALHASHLGCPSAYSSRLSYIKKRQVWKSRSETDWPHLGIMPGFCMEKNRSLLILTSTCWQDISLSNTVELTTVTPQKQTICRFKRRFLPVFENSRGSIVCLRTANPVTCHDWVVLFLRTSAWLSHWNGDVHKNKTAQSWHITRFAACRQTMEPLEFLKTGKKRRLKRQIVCSCGVTVVSSMVFEREMSCQHVMWMLKWEGCDFFPCRNLALFPGGVNQFLIGTFTPVSSLCMIVYYYRPMDSPSD